MLPVEIFAKVFPYLHDDPKSWYKLAHSNKQLHQISKALYGNPRKWKEVLVDFENHPKHAEFDYYVHQVKYAPNGRHMALMLRVYEGRDATDYYRIVRIIDIDDKGHSRLLPDIPVGRSTPFTAYSGQYFIAVEPRLVRVFDSQQEYKLVQCIPTVDRIVGIRAFCNDKSTTTTAAATAMDGDDASNSIANRPKIALQTEHPERETHCTLIVWDLLRGAFLAEIPYQGAAIFDMTEDGRIFACMDGGLDVRERPVRIIFMDDNNHNNYGGGTSSSNSNGERCMSRTYIMDLPTAANENRAMRRSWIDCCRFSPDGQRLAVLTEDRIFQMDVSVEPPQWIDGCFLNAPDDCTFSGQLQYSPDSRRILAHARTEWDNVYRGNENNLNTIQIWDAYNDFQLKATKGFHDLIGSVGVSADGTYVVVIQGNDSDVFRAPIARIVTRYIAAMDDYSPYPETGEEGDGTAARIDIVV